MGRTISALFGPYLWQPAPCLAGTQELPAGERVMVEERKFPAQKE